MPAHPANVNPGLPKRASLHTLGACGRSPKTQKRADEQDLPRRPGADIEAREVCRFAVSEPTEQVQLNQREPMMPRHTKGQACAWI